MGFFAITVSVSLFVARMSHMVSKEEGAWFMFENLRQWAEYSDISDWISEGLNCPFCVSVWIMILMIPPMLAFIPLGLAVCSWMSSFGLSFLIIGLMIEVY